MGLGFKVERRYFSRGLTRVIQIVFWARHAFANGCRLTASWETTIRQPTSS